MDCYIRGGVSDSMSTETVTEDSTEHGHEGPEHPSDWVYIKVALVLAVLTGIEITISYMKGLAGAPANTMLIVLGSLKFSIVALYFMHLKFDQPVLRRVFVGGIILAVIVYLAYLASLHAFGG